MDKGGSPKGRRNRGKHGGLTRREFLFGTVYGGLVAASGVTLLENCSGRGQHAEIFIGKARGYDADLASAIGSGLEELNVTASEIKGKRVLLKPNMVEPHLGAGHINTHPNVVRGAAEAFLRLGAAQVVVAEGPGHCRDSLYVLEESGLGSVLREDRIPFFDLNYDQGYSVANAGKNTDLTRLTFPVTVGRADWIVSIAKMKTHHWAGVTLSMKNLFGVMPGRYYGWPKNVLHWHGIDPCILDINMTLRPHFAILDGIVGMEGDGPIMGTPRPTGVLVLGRNPAAVDATGARISGINPNNVPHLVAASDTLGPIRERSIFQRGETIASVRTNYVLVEEISAHRGLRV